MPAASMNTRLAALEERTGLAQRATVVVMTSEETTDDELAEMVAKQKRGWRAIHGRPFPDDGFVLRILLVGVKPEDRRGADAH